MIVGVGNMHELGAGSTGNISVYGPARNPWDIERCPGGSSSGPGAAVAARLVAGAVGADGVGSIRYPAAYCGLTGLKPTFGRSAMDGPPHGRRTTTIVSGPLCADAADCRLLGSALFGEELAAGEPAGCGSASIRDAVSEDVAPGGARRPARRRSRRCARRAGGEVLEIELADLERLGAGRRPGRQRRGPRRASRPSGSTSSSPELSPINRGFAQVPDAAAGRRRASRRTRVRTADAPARWRRSSSEVDVLAWPTVPAVAPPLEAPLVELPSGRTTADQANVRGAGLANLTGIPAISVPVGLTPTGCRSACSCRPPGAATSCCSTPPRRSSGPTTAAGSRRCRRSRPPSTTAA